MKMHDSEALAALASPDVYSTPSEVAAACSMYAEQRHEENRSRDTTSIVDIPDAAFIYDPRTGRTLGSVGMRNVVNDRNSQSLAGINAIRNAQKEHPGELTDCILIQHGAPNALEVTTANQAGMRDIICISTDSTVRHDDNSVVHELNKVVGWPYHMRIRGDMGHAKKARSITNEYLPIQNTRGFLRTRDNRKKRTFEADFMLNGTRRSIDHRILKKANERQANAAAGAVENIVTEYESTDFDAEQVLDIPVVAAVGFQHTLDTNLDWHRTTNLRNGMTPEHAEILAINAHEAQLHTDIVAMKGDGEHVYPEMCLEIGKYVLLGSLECCAMCSFATTHSGIGGNWAVTLTESQVGKLFRVRKVAHETLSTFDMMYVHTPYIVEREAPKKYAQPIKRIHRSMSRMKRDHTTDMYRLEDTN